ncbi:MAG: histidine phosphatase family protein [Chloroflexi bacterium]|nr:histidine phosphatase family protein [Chloroflexota bacterium]
MTILYLVRHGETDWNRDGRVQGNTDIPLNSRGRGQARRLGERFADVPFDLVLSSPMSRCRETAEIAMESRDVPLQYEPDLREHGWGAWEGLTFAERAARYPEAAAALARGERALPDDAETWEALAERAARARRRLDLLGAGHVLVVTHGGTLNALLSDYLGLPLVTPARLRFASCSVSQIEVTEERAIVFRINDTCHLQGGEAAL